MDRGAARSRKRAKHIDQAGPLALAPRVSHHTNETPDGIRPPVQAGPSRDRSLEARQLAKKKKVEGSGPGSNPRGEPRGNRRPGGNPERPAKHRKARLDEREEQSRDPALYRPKAIRDSTALIYSSAPFEIPSDLKNVTRLDLEGSNASDICWIKGSRVTWLSVKGCAIETGWDAVGGLEGLTVLNVSDCQLGSLPKSLKQLGKLKALVAMNNPWTLLDEDVVSHWTQLNSLIVSHSPRLSRLPLALGSLYHLSKLTFSHCPTLVNDGIPDLSSLPLLRDVKMNNLRLLDTLPLHLINWGKGSMSSIEDPQSTEQSGKLDDAPRNGAGLQSLDIGNCALTYDTFTTTFLSSTSSFPALRSLTLHGNPLCDSRPDYVKELTDSPNVPRLQVVDNKRVKEKIKKETKEEIKARLRAEKKMRPSGSNGASSGTMRKWGLDKTPEGPTKVATTAMVPASREKRVEKDDGPTGVKRKRKRAEQKEPEIQKPTTANGKDSTERLPGTKKPRVETQPRAEDAKAGKVRPQSDIARPSTGSFAVPTLKSNVKPSKSQTSVVGIVQVQPERSREQGKGKPGKRKGETSGGQQDMANTGTSGLDLRELFSKQNDAGLGVESW